MRQQQQQSSPAVGPRRLAIVVKGYPRLSETFIAQELLALQRRGVDFEIFSLRHPTDPAVHPMHRDITAPVHYLPEYLKDEPGRVLRAWRRARRLPGYGRAWRQFVRDLGRDRSSNRLRRFGQACVLATSIAPTTNRIYAHFLHTPASVARYAALMTDLPWCASAHAKDIWTTPDWEKREKLADADWVVTCTSVGYDHLVALAPRPGSVELLYHGLDFTRFSKLERATPHRDGSNAGAPVILLSIGRAVEKKGYDDLLDALAAMPPVLNWQLRHIGGGALQQRLRARAEELGLARHILWLGPQPQEEVIRQYREADVFVLASRIAADGDRDGLPNVLMEAQSQDLACLSTRVAAIPELIIEEETGLLVAPGNPPELAAALQRLIVDPGLRQRLALAGARRVRENFAMQAGIDQLLARLAPSINSVAAQ